jgi:hypothetical protein
MVRLRNGEDVARSLVTPVMVSLQVLMQTDPVALLELAGACRDSTHVLFGGCADRLRGLALIQAVAPDGTAVIHDVTRAVVLSATEGDWDSLHLVSPVADGGEQE